MSADRPSAEPKPSIEKLNGFVATVMSEINYNHFSTECYAAIEVQRQRMIEAITSFSKTAAASDAKSSESSLTAAMGVFATLIHDVAISGSVLSQLKDQVSDQVTCDAIKKTFESNILLLKSVDPKVVKDAQKALHDLSKKLVPVGLILGNFKRLESAVSSKLFKRIKDFFKEQLKFLINADEKNRDTPFNTLSELSKQLTYWLSLSSLDWPLDSKILSDELLLVIQRLEDPKFQRLANPEWMNDYKNLNEYISVYINNKGHDSTAVAQTLNVLSPGIKAALQKVEGAKGVRMFSGKNTGDQIFAYIGGHKSLNKIVIDLRDNIVNGAYNASEDRFVYAVKALARIRPVLAYQILHPDAKQVPSKPAELLGAVKETVIKSFYHAQQDAKKVLATPAPSGAAKK